MDGGDPKAVGEMIGLCARIAPNTGVPLTISFAKGADRLTVRTPGSLATPPYAMRFNRSLESIACGLAILFDTKFETVVVSSD